MPLSRNSIKRLITAHVRPSTSLTVVPGICVLSPCLGSVEVSDINFRYGLLRFRFCRMVVHEVSTLAPGGSMIFRNPSNARPQLIIDICGSHTETIKSSRAMNSAGSVANRLMTVFSRS